ncbi:MAG: MATE family efflux transporter [Oscillospiraceae bacterium]|nr:MATE family efflux transporter [Oscillospiraceae bacterium]
MNSKAIAENPLGHEKLGKLILKFAVPSILTNLLNALYNVFDQIFTGHGLGEPGLAAISVTFPFFTIVAAISVMLGLGVAANFNLSLGAGNKKQAEKIVINGISAMLIAGISLAVIFTIFLRPLLFLFGADDTIIDLAADYMQIVIIGVPFQMLTVGLTSLIRADGSPHWSLLCMLFGAAVNIILDPVLMFTAGMGIRGVALSTALGQFISAVIAVTYLARGMKTIDLPRRLVIPEFALLKRICALGAAPFSNQLAMTLVAIVLNSVLLRHGAQSVYGSTVAIGAVGAISRLNIIFVAFVIGVGQGCQPINGFNFGAKNYVRVRQTLKTAFVINTVIAFIFFAMFQLFPVQIIRLFGDGSPEYFRFATRYLQVFMFMTFSNGLQPLAASYFSATGRAKMGIFVSFTRQIIFLLPLLLILPAFMGIDGIMIAGPIADSAAAILAGTFVVRELRKLNRLISEQERLGEGMGA